MPEEESWNEESRDDLRETLHWYLRGELRLKKYDEESIVEGAREIYIEDECPEDEWSTFVQFAEQELKQTKGQLAAEQATWPAETDCDRLDRAEAILREQGILLWQASPCCDTCTYGEMQDRVNRIDQRHPGFQKKMRGYAFFIDQTLPETLSEGTKLSVYLGYGWISPDESEVTEDAYETKALAIAHEVADCLKEEGLEVNWNGDFSRKIGVSLQWQRRTMLE